MFSRSAEHSKFLIVSHERAQARANLGLLFLLFLSLVCLFVCLFFICLFVFVLFFRVCFLCVFFKLSLAIYIF